VEREIALPPVQDTKARAQSLIVIFVVALTHTVTKDGPNFNA
jgi:hypothetical protein